MFDGIRLLSDVGASVRIDEGEVPGANLVEALPHDFGGRRDAYAGPSIVQAASVVFQEADDGLHEHCVLDGLRRGEDVRDGHLWAVLEFPPGDDHEHEQVRVYPARVGFRQPAHLQKLFRKEHDDGEETFSSAQVDCVEARLPLLHQPSRPDTPGGIHEVDLQARLCVDELDHWHLCARDDGDVVGEARAPNLAFEGVEARAPGGRGAADKVDVREGEAEVCRRGPDDAEDCVRLQLCHQGLEPIHDQVPYAKLVGRGSHVFGERSDFFADAILPPPPRRPKYVIRSALRR